MFTLELYQFLWHLLTIFFIRLILNRHFPFFKNLKNKTFNNLTIKPFTSHIISKSFGCAAQEKLDRSDFALGGQKSKRHQVEEKLVWTGEEISHS